MARPIARIELTPDQRKSLQGLARRPSSSQSAALRARIILASNDGRSQEAIALQQGVRRRIVSKWCQRFRRRGMEGLEDAKGRGRKVTLSAQQREKVLVEATRPPKGYRRWSVRRMAKASGMSVGS